MTEHPPQDLFLSHQLGSILLNKGIVSIDQLDVVLKEQQLQKSSFEDCLLNLGFLSEAALAEILSTTSGREKINLKTILLDPSLKTILPREAAERFRLLPLSLEEGHLRVAMADVYNLPALDYLRQTIPDAHDIHPLIASESDILEAIDGVYGYDLSLRGLLRDVETTSPQILKQEGHVNPTIRLVNAILLDAIKLNASDIHFEPEGAFMRLRYRIDGILSQISTLHSSYWPAMCVRLKVMAEMNIAETRQPQNGHISFSVGAREIDLRVASHPTIHGENIVVRILDKSRSLLTLHDLGYSPMIMTQVQRALKRPEGIFIITGPTGCGKTTSLYSMLSYMSSPHLNIMTLEEPVEYQLPLIRQSEIRPLSGMGFEEGVRSILRQDPDIILIGEIRDPGTAKMALRAAMTGHQVFSTLHTNDAFGSIHRLMDLGLHPAMLASNLRAIIAQRLVRRLCHQCKMKRKATRQEMSLLSLSSPRSLYTAKGCEACRGTGYRGRLALAEIVVFDQELDEALISSPSSHHLKSLAQKKGFLSLKQDAQERVLRGDTSIEEVLTTIDLENAP